jgi:O-antigen/teichoic acid export membrane protein
MEAGRHGERPKEGRVAARAVLTAFLKLLDVGARSLFVLLGLFALPARETGQFGLLLILTAFFAFFAGYERYLDLQRGLARLDAAAGDRLVLSTLRLYAVNYLIAIPMLVACLMFWADLPGSLAAMGVLVAVGEHLSNEAYRVAVILRRYRQLFIIAAGKNGLLVVTASALWWLEGMSLTLSTLMALWSGLSMGTLLVLGVAFLRRTSRSNGSMTPLVQQITASRTHFVIGLTAVLSLQIDRLIAGAFLPLETSGVYFRHVFLASVAYQALGIVSFNRIMPIVYRHVARREIAPAVSLVRRERVIVVLAYAGLAVAAMSLETLKVYDLPSLDRVVPAYLGFLILAFMIRNLADYNSLLLNASFRERDVLRSQLVGLIVSFLTAISLAPQLGILGLLISILLGASGYLVASTVLRRRTEFAHLGDR